MNAAHRLISRGLLGLVVAGALAALLGGLGGCASTGIALKEKLGIPKREQLVARVEDARDSQQEAKKQFSSALEEFIAVTGAKGGELEAKYNQLKSEYERSEKRAEAVHGRIADVERVGEALFKEWRAELGQYTDANLRRTSERQLDQTRTQYDRLIDAMKAAEGKMQPVLAAFKDQVLFLKHNLNAQAVASLRSSVAEVQGDVRDLVRDMEKSIAEADSFIRQMKAVK